jgi:sporulation protein YlmC with PRC-barrel domain
MKEAYSRRLRHFEPLSRLGDYQVGPHQVDPRGWNVLSPDGRTVGEVKDLIVDTERMRGRYLYIELAASALEFHADPHILVPVEQARRDGKHHRLIVDGLAAGRVAELIEARDRHIETFWERWWSGDGEPVGGHAGRRLSPEDLRRALEDVRPGEQVRIPVVEEEIIVERRVVTRDQ